MENSSRLVDSMGSVQGMVMGEESEAKWGIFMEAWTLLPPPKFRVPPNLAFLTMSKQNASTVMPGQNYNLEWEPKGGEVGFCTRTSLGRSPGCGRAGLGEPPREPQATCKEM